MRFRLRTRAAAAFGATYLVFATVAAVSSYVLVQRSLDRERPAQRLYAAALDTVAEERGLTPAQVAELQPKPPLDPVGSDDKPSDPLAEAASEISSRAIAAQRQETLDVLLRTSVLVGALTAVAASTAGWFVARRVLQPVGLLTAAARHASSENLGERVALSGPRDELSEMADTFDDMLDRLQAAFDAQRRFTAGAAHELRTPLAVVRAEIDAARSDPSAHPRELALAAAIGRANERSERLVSALLDLARVEIGEARTETFDLADVVGDRLVEDAHLFSDRGLRLELDLDHAGSAAAVVADRAGIDVLVRNVVHNAAVHARGGTTVLVALRTVGRSVVFTVRNESAPLDPVIAARLGEPFQRGADRRGSDGHGLGLAIIRGAAAASGATVRIRQPTSGEFEVEVVFAVPSSAVTET